MIKLLFFCLILIASGYYLHEYLQPNESVESIEKCTSYKYSIQEESNQRLIITEQEILNKKYETILDQYQILLREGKELPPP